MNVPQGQPQIIVGILVILLLVGGVVAYEYYFPPKPPPAIEITGLQIDGTNNLQASAKDGSYTDVTYNLKHNDGLKHTVTVMFNLTAEGARYVTIVTQPGQPLSSSGTTFQYDKTVDPTDSLLPQRVSVFAHISGLPSVTVNITISLSIDGQPAGNAQTVTLAIST